MPRIIQFAGSIHPVLPQRRNLTEGAQLSFAQYSRNIRFQHEGREPSIVASYSHRNIDNAAYDARFTIPKFKKLERQLGRSLKNDLAFRNFVVMLQPLKTK